MSIEVISVSKTPQRLTEVASAIQIITNEDIRRSGATNIPEALRLAPNLQVSQLNSSSWIISARGFNTVFANKLLVMIDGRTVYTPLFGGVIWDLQSVLLEDVDRIEVISGPGGSLWGVNAVNGVINIITRKVRDTHGLYVTAAAGTFMKLHAAARYADSIGSKIFYRVYAQHSERNVTYRPDGSGNNDSWRNTQMGFGLGLYPTQRDFITVQGDVNVGTRDIADGSVFDTQNLITRWNRTLNERSNFSLQLYYDRYWTNDPTSLGDQMNTFDVDFQHRTMLGNRHHVLWGLEYRHVNDHVFNRVTAGVLPPKKVMPVYSGFIQDEISLRSDLKLTVGSKFLNNIYSGFEIQPSARLTFTPDEKNTIWTAVSRAIRAPSRFDVEYFLPLEPQPPGVPSVAGGPNFDSEKLKAFELGYRAQASSVMSVSLAGFYNIYNDVYSVEPLPGTLTYQIQNGSQAKSWGGEFSGTYQVTSKWKLRGGFTYFGKDLRAKEGHQQDPSYLANDAKHHLLLQSMLDLPFNFKIDVVARYMDYIPSTFATVRIPEYATADFRFWYEYRDMVISVTGQNIVRSRHSEYDALKIPRNFFARITFRF